MLRSLVGSEMCIRDSHHVMHKKRHHTPTPIQRSCLVCLGSPFQVCIVYIILHTNTCMCIIQRCGLTSHLLAPEDGCELILFCRTHVRVEALEASIESSSPTSQTSRGLSLVTFVAPTVAHTQLASQVTIMESENAKRGGGPLAGQLCTICSYHNRVVGPFT